VSNYNEVKSSGFIEIKDEEFQKLRDLIYSRIGINLTEEKRNLLSGRLQKVLRKMKMASFIEYYNYVNDDKSGLALSDLANLISTNHTFFGRESDHFEYFKTKVLPEIVQRKKMQNTKDIRIWSAGCSSGEEPYTLVMYLMEYFGNEYDKWDAGVLATDISQNVLDIALKGVYSADRLKSMPKTLQTKYFKKLPDGNFEVIPKVKKEVTFRRFNLMNKTFPFKKPFDSIFCRNVMIYFDNPTRQRLTDKFYNSTANDGYLFIGHSETLNRDTTRYKYVMPAVYKKI
jgi:chemotaxis protein methyltransferase CheR